MNNNLFKKIEQNWLTQNLKIFLWNFICQIQFVTKVWNYKLLTQPEWKMNQLVNMSVTNSELSDWRPLVSQRTVCFKTNLLSRSVAIYRYIKERENNFSVDALLLREIKFRGVKLSFTLRIHHLNLSREKVSRINNSSYFSFFHQC